MNISTPSPCPSSSSGGMLANGMGSSSFMMSGQDEPELCLVCNDVATGYHYGTPSCNGCKTFFRRTVMKKQSFQCQYDGNCPVDKSVRCACRHCRFKKCLAVGMNKDAIQQNRDPIGYTKRTRRYPMDKQHAQPINGVNEYSVHGSSAQTPFQESLAGTSSFSGSAATVPQTMFPGHVHGQFNVLSAMPNTSAAPSTSSFNNMFPPFPTTTATAPNSYTGMMQPQLHNPLSLFNPSAVTNNSFYQHQQIHQQQIQPQQKLQQQPPMTMEQMQEDLLLRRLIGIEQILLTIRNSKLSVQKTLCDLVLSRSIFDDASLISHMTRDSFQMPNVLRRAQQEDYLYWHEKDWFIMIEWAKMLPVYQLLSVPDKLALLRHSAITYPSLIQCFYTPDVGPDTIVFPNGAFFDRTLDPTKPTGFQRKNFKMLDNLLNPIRKMQIDQNEFAGAKAVFFLNPGNFEDDADDLSPEAKSHIAVARSAITNSLYRYMVHKRGTEEAADKFGKLLLLGTAIATMSCEMKEAVVVADFFDQIRFSGFARQLLLAKDESDLDQVELVTLPSGNVDTQTRTETLANEKKKEENIEQQKLNGIGMTQLCGQTMIGQTMIDRQVEVAALQTHLPPPDHPPPNSDMLLSFVPSSQPQPPSAHSQQSSTSPPSLINLS